MLDRRRFLSSVSGAAAGIAALTSPSSSFGHNLLAQLEKTPPLPDHSLLDKNEDAYWAEMRKQFLIPEDEVYLNNGTVGSSPAPVLRAIFDGYNTTEKMDQEDPEDYPIWGYAAWNEFRDPLAEFVGCKRDEIALLRNATEANSYIANGIDLKPGDEVLMTDQEHPGGEHPWNLKAKRYGIVVKKVDAAPPGEGCGAGTEPVQRRDHAAHARAVLQPHHDIFRRGASGQRIVRAGAQQRHSIGRRWRARAGNDAA